MSAKTFKAIQLPGLIKFNVEVEGVHEVQLTAMQKGRIVGRVGVLCHLQEIACIRQLYVEPASRKQGIGQWLVDECCKEAAIQGSRSINLTVAAVNRQVIPWYVKQGFWPFVQYEDGMAVLAKRLQ